MRPEEDSPEQKVYRELRGKLLAGWQEAGMLDAHRVWSKHDGKHKAAMCREAMEKLKWSVHRFDQRMEDWISHARRKSRNLKKRQQKKKKKKKRKRKRDDSSSSDSDSDSDSSDSGEDKKLKAKKSEKETSEPGPAPQSFNNGDHVSLVDDEGRQMCHGIMIDDEVKIPTTGMAKYGEVHESVDECGTGDYKTVKIMGVCK